MLRIIQNELGGSIKPRSGVQAVRWRLHNKEGIIDLIHRINGNIRHSSRLKQLHHLCSKQNIEVKTPQSLLISSGWFGGFFDADGTIGFSFKGQENKKHPQLSISVTNKLQQDVESFKLFFGGNIYYDRAQNGNYKWEISDKEDVIYFCKHIGSFSCKSKRLKLVPNFYYLKELKSYNYPQDSANYKNWAKLTQKWS